MKKLFFLSLLILLLSACSNPDLNKIGTKQKERLTESELGSYASKVSYEIGDRPRGEKYDYAIDFIIEGNDSFDELGNNEKLDMFSEFYNSYLHSGPVDCGEPECRWGNVIFKTSENEYNTDGTNMFINDEEEYTWEEMIEENRDTSDTESAREEESESVSESVTESVTNDSSDLVYEYMKAEYERITNYGETYIPEVHDPMVSKLAAERFGITEKEAGDIYVSKEMGW